MGNYILCLNMSWRLFLRPLLGKIGIGLLFISRELLPQLSSCILEGPEVCLWSRCATRYLSCQLANLILVLLIEDIASRPPADKFEERAMWTGIVVVEPCPSLLQVLSVDYWSGWDWVPYSHSILLIKHRIRGPESIELSHDPPENLLPGLCVGTLKFFKIWLQDVCIPRGNKESICWLLDPRVG